MRFFGWRCRGIWRAAIDLAGGSYMVTGVKHGAGLVQSSTPRMDSRTVQDGNPSALGGNGGGAGVARSSRAAS